MDIAKILKDIRKTKDWDQQEIARRLGTTQQTISNWEQGAMPRASAIKRINRLLEEIGTPPISLKTVAHQVDTPVSRAKSMLIVLKAAKPTATLDRLFAAAAERNLSVFITSDPEEAVRLIETIPEN